MNYVWCQFQKEGIHCYPDAGTNPDLAGVSYLQYPHRHIFHFKVYIEVYHDDREIEFILFKQWLETVFRGKKGERILDVNNKSCEMISNDLYNVINNRYPNRKVKIEVSEDGENGSYIEY